MQILLTVVSLIAVATFALLFYRVRKNERKDVQIRQRHDLNYYSELCMQEIANLTRDDDISISTDKYFETVLRSKQQLAWAVDMAPQGLPKAVSIVMSKFNGIITRELPTEEDCLALINFNAIEFEDPNIQWETLVHFLQKTKMKNYMSYLCKQYHLDEEREIENEFTGEMQKRRLFDVELLHEIIQNEVPKEIPLSDMQKIITRCVYNISYGIGCVTALRASDIDGFNFGTSGSVRYKINGSTNAIYKTTNSVWVQMNAKWIHFSFLSFMNEEEMKRIINQLTSWGTMAPMTEHTPYKVNDAYDGARVTAIRPPAGECWAVFVRKFSSGLYSKEKLLNKPYVKNWELVSTLIYYLMRGEQTTAFTGQQNTGKTSMMKAAMADVAMVNIRILEMSFELAIRELYPWKNVFTVKPTDYVSASQLQDLLKKTDSYLSMVGEVAEDIVAARMIQFCLIASAFTIFSHHGEDDASLINGLANSLVACGEYENHDVALSTVLDAIHNNVHLNFVKGNRVVEYISEIVKLAELEPYPKLKKSRNVVEALDQMTAINREYYTRSTDRVRFESRYIIKFNAATGTYEPCDGYTPKRLESILSHLEPVDRQNFIKWYRKNWAHTLEAA